MNRRSFFQHLGGLAAAGAAADRVAAQQLSDRVAAQPSSIDEMRHARMVIGNDAWDLIPKFARASSTVLVTGEPGSGRTLAARVVHERSPWADAPLLTVDCSLRSSIGRAGSMTQGTLVLENVAALDRSEQQQLLEWMREYRQADRLIFTTTPTLRRLADRGIFSEELYYRIDIIPLTLRPLRERPQVILPLAEYLATRAAAAQNKAVPHITPPAVDLLLRYGWPGNVRELERVMTLGVGRARHNAITPADLIVES